MTMTLSIVGFGVLFALYAVVQGRRPQCSGNCGSCSNACADDNAQD
jgi:hypothetical protein